MTGSIAIVGASGLVGANIAKLALSKGYRVSGGMRNVEPARPHLEALTGAERLTLYSADMMTPDARSIFLHAIEAIAPN